ncbi:MAG: VCBS repeat-containing protein [Desulfobacteraceae bacterium]|nr:MAG: VCBS repeat-containing protein [Desulfobacteraceae bacterium]
MKYDKKVWKTSYPDHTSRMVGYSFLLVFTLLIFCATGALSKEITLSWTRNPDPVDGYKVFSRLPDRTYDYQNPAINLPVSACSSEGCAVSVAVPDNLDVYFVVRAYLKSGVESQDSNETVYRGMQSILPKEIVLSWTPNKDAVAGYRIFRRTIDGQYDYSKPISSIPSSGCTSEKCFTPISLTPFQDCYFVVRAYSGANVESPNSNEVFFDIDQFVQGLAGTNGTSGTTRGAVSGLSETVTGKNITPDQEITSENRDLHPAVEVLNSRYEHQEWIRIMWTEYVLANGEARVAMGDLDGDRKDEMIIGLGPGHDPAIPGGMFQILDDDYSHLTWGRIGWAEYNTENGESFPACGDVDGDGIDEIFIGLGEGGQGKVEVFHYRSGAVHHQGWAQVDWPEYNQYFGKTRPTCGDIDQDGRDEVVLGLGSNQSDPAMPAGLFQIIDHDFSSLAWGEVDWPDYNLFNGETYPGCANLNGEGKNHIVVGLGNGGEGRMEVFEYRNGAASHKDWVTIDWDAYNQTVGETRPACGDIDGDGKDEIIVGLASNLDDPQIPGGIFPILDHDYTHLAWSEINWPEYNAGNGESFPTSGDTDADQKDEIIIGLGVSNAFAAGGLGGETPDTASGSFEAENKGGCFISSF